MEKFYSKKGVIITLFIIVMLIIPTMSYAANEDVAIINVDEDYLIYIEGKENTPFKFAFTNDKILDETTAKAELTFVSNWDDTNGVNVACLEKQTTLDLTKPVFLWILEDETASAIELDLTAAILKSEMENVENLTSVIDVDTTKTISTVEEKDGVKTTTTVGKLEITDSKDYEYKYQLVKLDGTEPEETKNLMTLIDDLQKSYSEMSMYNKILLTTQIKNAIENAKYEVVKDMTILQPENSKDGDRYLVLLQKVAENKVEEFDIQFLNCTYIYENEKVTEKNVIKTTSALPVTYDSIILLIVLIGVVIAIVVTVIRIKKLNNKNEK